jgi:catalase-peroxidase
MVRPSLVALTLGAAPLAIAASCPYIAGNHAAEAPSQFNRRDEAKDDMPSSGRCARMSKIAGGGTRSSDFWPCQLSLAILRQNTDIVNPMDADYDYAKEFADLDGESRQKDDRLIAPRSKD